MILNFLIAFVFLFLFVEIIWKKEGFIQTNETTASTPPIPYDPEPSVDCEIDHNINIKLPIWDVTTKSYIDTNQYLFNNYQNILKYANTPCK